MRIVGRNSRSVCALINQKKDHLAHNVRAAIRTNACPFFLQVQEAGPQPAVVAVREVASLEQGKLSCVTGMMSEILKRSLKKRLYFYGSNVSKGRSGVFQP